MDIARCSGEEVARGCAGVARCVGKEAARGCAGVARCSGEEAARGCAGVARHVSEEVVLGIGILAFVRNAAVSEGMRDVPLSGVARREDDARHCVPVLVWCWFARQLSATAFGCGEHYKNSPMRLIPHPQPHPCPLHS